MSEQNSPLFPAYPSSSSSSFTVDVNSIKVENQEWLVNSSFTADAYQSFIKTEQSSQDEEIKLECVDQLKIHETKEEKPPTKKKARFFPGEDVSLPKKNSNAEKPAIQSIFWEQSGLTYDRAYRIDTKYDSENFALESFDVRTIPKYKHKTCLPLGASEDKLSDYVEVRKEKAPKHSARYFSRGCVKQIKVPGGKVVNSNKESSNIPKYLPFNTYSNMHVIEAHSMVNFDGISQDWKSYFNKDSKITLPTKENFEAVDIELKEKITNFNNALTELPQDEKLWLDFVAFQQDIFQSPPFLRIGLTETAMYEKQIAILDKALKYNPNSVQLTVCKLEILRNIEEKEKMISLWENLIFYHPNNAMAWKHYFKFILSDISYFSVPRIIKMFSKCITILSGVLEGRMKSHRAPPDLMAHMLDIFGSICTVIQGFGLKELALSSFQAQIEFNLFAPSVALNAESCADQITFFEPFWDSGVPRIGEENAVGWSKTVSEKIITASAAASILGLEQAEDVILQQKLPQWQTWLEFEKLRESKHFLPWRPNPDLDQEADDLDDPERMVCFDNISGFLFRIDNERRKFFLLCEFFSFLGVCLHCADCSLFCRKDKHSLLVSEHFDHVYAAIKDIFPNQEIPEILAMKYGLSESLNFSFIESVFQQSIEVFSDTYKSLISLIWLRHKLNSANIKHDNKNSLGNLKKFAKTLLKRTENRNCLFLWSEYIHLEWLSSNKESASKTFETLLTSSTSLETYDCRVLWHFVKKFIELCLGIKTLKKSDFSESRNKILWILSHIGRTSSYVAFDSSQPDSSSALMKAMVCFKNMLSTEVFRLTSTDEFLCACLDPLSSPILDCATCVVYFHYILQGLDAALHQYQDVILHVQNLAKEKPSHNLNYIEEQLYVSQAELLYFHSWNLSQSMKTVQTFLYDVVERFPWNVKLLYMLLKIKVSLPVIGPTRRFFYKLIKSSKQLTPITWLFSIISELIICFSIHESLSFDKEETFLQNENSYLRNCGIVWKIRSLFDGAHKCPNSRHSVALWRSHIKYEMMIGETAKAKNVFHEALQNCSWVKALYLDGVEYFHEDLRYLLETMHEKQMRVYTPLEEVQLLMEHAVKND